MDRQQILELLDEIFCEILDLEDIQLNESTNADQIEEWDSLAHVQLVIEIQKKFGVKFTSKEIANWKNIGDILDSIQK